MKKRKNNLLKLVGLIGAGTLVIFGGFSNLLRTIKFTFKKFKK